MSEVYHGGPSRLKPVESGSWDPERRACPLGRFSRVRFFSDP